MAIDFIIDYNCKTRKTLTPDGMKRFGCYIDINYPISWRAQSWLADTSRKKVTGGSFNRMRKDTGGMFFELKEPLEIAINKAFFSKKAVNTDKIFNILFEIGRMKNPHTMMRLYFSGGLDIQNADKEREESWMVFHIKDTDNSSTSMLKEFFRALFISYGWMEYLHASEFDMGRQREPINENDFPGLKD